MLQCIVNFNNKNTKRSKSLFANCLNFIFNNFYDIPWIIFFHLQNFHVPKNESEGFKCL